MAAEGENPAHLGQAVGDAAQALGSRPAHHGVGIPQAAQQPAHHLLHLFRNLLAPQAQAHRLPPRSVLLGRLGLACAHMRALWGLKLRLLWLPRLGQLLSRRATARWRLPSDGHLGGQTLP